MTESIYVLLDGYDPGADPAISLHRTLEGARRRAKELVEECYKTDKESPRHKTALREVANLTTDNCVEYASEQYLTLDLHELEE